MGVQEFSINKKTWGGGLNPYLPGSVGGQISQSEATPLVTAIVSAHEKNHHLFFQDDLKCCLLSESFPVGLSKFSPKADKVMLAVVFRFTGWLE